MSEAFSEIIETAERAIAGSEADKSELSRFLDGIDLADVGEPEDRAYLAALLDSLGMTEEAMLALRPTGGEQDHDAGMPNLAGALASRHGEYTQASELFRRALSAAGDNASLRARVMANLAALDLISGEVSSASTWLAEAREACGRVNDSAMEVLLASTEFGIARTRDDLHGMRGALSWLNEATRARVAELGSDHPLALTAVASLAAAEFELAAVEKSIENQERAITVLEVVAHRLAADLGAEHLQALACLENLCVADLRLALANRSMDRARRAASALQSVSHRTSAALGERHPQARAAAANAEAARLDLEEALADGIAASSQADRTIDRLRRHLAAGAARLDSLSESFSLFVYEVLQDVLTDVDLRLLLHDHSLEQFPLNGLEAENLKRARLDQHRIARAFVTWAEEHLKVKTLARHTRGTWTSVDGSSPYVIDGAGLDGESSGLVASQNLYFPQESADTGRVAQTIVNFERMWFDNATTRDAQQDFLDAARALFVDRSAESVYLRVLTSLFSDFVEESGAETAARGKTGFYDSVVWGKLYKFQRDGVLGAIEKLESHNGCIIADSVGLGKTFEALAVIKYYELRNNRVLVLTPKRLRENWTIYRSNDLRNPLVEDRFSYDVLNHTDLSRASGLSGDIDLANINWGNYDLVVIDESHNFRNNPQVKDRVTRYERLMSEVFRAGVKTKVLMLSATPVNTRLADLKNQVLFATEGDDRALAADGIKSIEATLNKAQRRFNEWQRTPADTRTTKSLAGTLGMDYIRLLDLITIARSRKHIQKYYGTRDVGKFPDRLPPVNLTPPIDSAGAMIPLEQINHSILRLNLAAYKPTSYVSAKYEAKYAALYDQQVRTGGQRVWKQTDRENNVVHLLRVGLLKRLESSVNSLGKTLSKILATIDNAIDSIDAYEKAGGEGTSIDSLSDLEIIDLDDPQFEDTVGGNVKVFLADIDRIRWKQELQQDRDTIAALLAEVQAVNAARDAKLARLKQFLRDKAEHPTNDDNRKALVFTAFSDTAEYLYEHVARWAADELGMQVALITGQTTRATLPMKRTHMIDVLTAFSPRSKGGDPASPQIDLVIATDTISEGQNLQDCDTVINYDIHWNPVRIVQRFGRVDRLGTTNTSVQLVNFWPDIDLDSYINLETRVSSRLTLLDVSATGEENILDVTSKEMNDLDYRRKQLKQMQDSAPTMEDLADGLSITDLTLSDFRMDAAARQAGELQEITKWPLAIFGVTRFDNALADDGLAPGAVFLLRARDDAITFSRSYPLAPYALAYVTDDGTLAHDIEEPKLALDVLRNHCLGSTEPDPAVLAEFDKATRSGRSMSHYRNLLEAAARAVSGAAEESLVASLFSAGPSQLGTDAAAPGLESVDVIAWVAILP